MSSTIMARVAPISYELLWYFTLSPMKLTVVHGCSGSGRIMYTKINDLASHNLSFLSLSLSSLSVRTRVKTNSYVAGI